MAERVGPTTSYPVAGFQDQCFQPSATSQVKIVLFITIKMPK